MNPYLMTGPERVAYCGQLMESMTAMIQHPAARILNEEQTRNVWRRDNMRPASCE